MAVAMDNAILENILRQVRPLIGQGKVADYIPALATVDRRGNLATRRQRSVWITVQFFSATGNGAGYSA